MDPPSPTASMLTCLDYSGKVIPQHIQDFVNGDDEVPPRRRQYILVEHLVASLLGYRTMYSELHTIVDSLKIGSSGMIVFDRTKWAMKESDINTIVQQLQNHKASLNLTLFILRSTSTIEMRQTMRELHSLVKQLRRGEDDLYEQLSRLRGARTLSSSASNVESILNDSMDDNDDAVVRTITPANSISLENVNESTMGSFTFDNELANSRVYSRIGFLYSKTHSETSLAGSGGRTMATTWFSSIYQDGVVTKDTDID